MDDNKTIEFDIPVLPDWAIDVKITYTLRAILFWVSFVCAMILTFG